jgi:DNA repair protein RadC
MANLPISCWAREDIPTNRAEELGYKALSDVELLSIIIGSGSYSNTSIDLAREVLYHCNNNVKGLSKLTERDLLRMKGLGKTKLARIIAAMELGTRAYDASREERVKLDTATKVYNHYRHRMADLDVEEFWVSFLNQDNKLIKDVRISRGGFTETSVDIRLIMREAVLANATICFASKKIFYREILKDLYQHSDDFDFTGKQKSQIQGLIQTLNK